MHRAPLANHQQQRVAASLPFVESLARRMASTMPHSIDLGDLVQDGVLGLIDAAHRFDEDRGIKCVEEPLPLAGLVDRGDAPATSGLGSFTGDSVPSLALGVRERPHDGAR